MDRKPQLNDPLNAGTVSRVITKMVTGKSPVNEVIG